ncbi:MAG: hypothetical protein CVU05_01825 [Bacteroidetes bacterium HGW-Bacteroidetes-21]|jgi:hypothetical protein|nr:MAG: hypothetical protein CVU05_01825 [Bacteroidetes bacterium HGW-Bacteroidetes-21]
MKTIIIILTIGVMFGLTIGVQAQCVTNAGNDTVICGLTLSLNAEGSFLNQSQIWTCLSPGVTFSDPNSQNSTVVVINAGVYTFTWSITDEIGSTCSDDVVVTFNQIPNPEAGPDFSVCGSYAELNATNTTGNGYWTGPINAWYNASSWNSIPPDTAICSNCYTDSNVVVYYPSENNMVTYFWHEFNGSCYRYDSVNVFFGSIQEALPLVDEADSINCGRSFERLNAQYPAYGSGYWYDAVANTTFYPNPNLAHPDSACISSSSYGMHYFYWVTVNGDCRDTSDMVPVNFIRRPLANAGGDYWPGIFGTHSEIKTDTVCGLSYFLDSQPSYGSGMWFTLDPINTWFSSNNSSSPSSIYNDTVNVNNYTSYNPPFYKQFVWMEDNYGCVDKDTLRIYFMEVPHPDAGLDFSVCGKYAELNATSTIGNGYWTAPTSSWFNATAWHAGDTTYCPSCYTDPNVVYYYPSENDTVTMYWMEFDGICYGYDSVNVYFGAISPSILI